MITESDRCYLRGLKLKLEHEKNHGDAEEYHRLYSEMLTYANKLVAAQRWWEIWGKEEAFAILRGVFPIPPYLGRPTHDQITADLAIHREIGKNLEEQTASLERTELVVKIVDNVATAVGIVVGVGTTTVVIKELVKRVGVRKAGELLAEEFIKNQIKQEIQDKAIDELADALGVDPETAHAAANLAQVMKDARRRPRPPVVGTKPPTPVAPARPRPELAALNKNVAVLQKDQQWAQHSIMVQPKTPRPKFRESTTKALGALQPGDERRHVVPWEYMRDMAEATLTDQNWRRVATRLGYDAGGFKNLNEFKGQWQRDLFNEKNNVWKGSASGNPRGKLTGEDRFDWGVLKEKRQNILDSVLTDENWQRFAQRAGYNPADFKDKVDFQGKWRQDWESERTALGF